MFHGMLEEVLAGLRKNPKSLPSKYFYDRRGFKLFEEICELDEYYLTRAELAIMEVHGSEMAKAVGEQSLLIELGIGTGEKTRLLLSHLSAPVGYVPIDVSQDMLNDLADSLGREFRNLVVIPVCADWMGNFELPMVWDSAVKRVVYFPGSTIGNVDRLELVNFLRKIRELCGRGGGFLVGMDLKKDRATLEAAYNDSRGITAEFNLNILHHINKALNADFNLDNFRHYAPYNEEDRRIEMVLISTCDQEVHIGKETIRLDDGEPILTEISCKYDLREIGEMARGLFQIKNIWTDVDKRFSVQYLVAV
ncbi:MAG: L-histidine N(alpha)-methyltransferase [Candidatus Marinimicrobia bacterium]|nr:L-histidine N(alpha)-methyltransferase [Candidatus Neomarinimicrobiota bacterium]